MRKFFQKILATLAASSVVIGLSASPARAEVVRGCPEYQVCLYQWLNYGGNRWQSSFTNIYNHNEPGATNCMNIAPAAWSNGTPVNDNSAAAVTNSEPDATNVWSNYNLYFFNWINCNPDGGVSPWDLRGDSVVYDLRLVHWLYKNTNIKLYHTITSMQLIPRASALDVKLQAQLAAKRK